MHERCRRSFCIGKQDLTHPCGSSRRAVDMERGLPCEGNCHASLCRCLCLCVSCVSPAEVEPLRYRCFPRLMQGQIRKHCGAHMVVNVGAATKTIQPARRCHPSIRYLCCRDSGLLKPQIISIEILTAQIISSSCTGSPQRLYALYPVELPRRW